LKHAAVNLARMFQLEATGRSSWTSHVLKAAKRYLREGTPGNAFPESLPRSA
jgi:hypothetical protein